MKDDDAFSKIWKVKTCIMFTFLCELKMGCIFMTTEIYLYLKNVLTAVCNIVFLVILWTLCMSDSWGVTRVGETTLLKLIFHSFHNFTPLLSKNPEAHPKSTGLNSLYFTSFKYCTAMASYWLLILQHWTPDLNETSQQPSCSSWYVESSVERALWSNSEDGGFIPLPMFALWFSGM